jgi:hypothetical protein
VVISPKQEWLVRQFDDARAQFIRTEIETGLTFCNVAGTTSSPKTRERNIKNARKALETAGESLQKATLSADDKNHLTERLMALSRSVEELDASLRDKD